MTRRRQILEWGEAILLLIVTVLVIVFVALPARAAERLLGVR